MPASKRLEKFITENYCTVNGFCKATGIGNYKISRYINRKSSISFDILRELHNYGLNLTWLVTGKGEMFADNEVGEKLRMNHNKKKLKVEKNTAKIKKIRIELWILENFKSIENFCKEAELDEDYVEAELHRKRLTPDFVQFLIQRGCNINWLRTGKGSKYSNTPDGIVLRKRFKANTDSSEDDDKRIAKIDKKDLYEVVEQIVKEVLNKEEGK